MVVNSVEFLFFFVIVFLLYYLPFRSNVKLQNIVLLAGSFFFYGICEIKMIPLLFISILVFYFIGIQIERYRDKNNVLTSVFSYLGIVLGIGLLIYFKYFNFFIESISSSLTAIGLHSNLHTFNIILPIGISFFTFKLISYTLEIERGNITASHDIVAFSNYISFFPTILSGPIDRPGKFLPQLAKFRSFNYNTATDGCKQILWGMIKKMLIADNIALFVDPCWTYVNEQSSFTLLLAIIFFPIQLYMDFSGYSDMAIGVGKLLNISVAKNFNYPFFGRNIAEYWRNWHMSLTGWLTDYVFMPLNIKYRDYGVNGSIFAIILTFVLIGMWHGASWTFVLFGLYQGLLYIPLMKSGAFFKKKKIKLNKSGYPCFKDFRKMVFTYFLFSVGLILFKAPSLLYSYHFLHAIVNNWSLPLITVSEWSRPVVFFGLSCLLIVHEWNHRKDEYAFSAPLFIKSHFFRIVFYYVVFAVVLAFAADSTQFIYFQF